LYTENVELQTYIQDLSKPSKTLVNVAHALRKGAYVIKKRWSTTCEKVIKLLVRPIQQSQEWPVRPCNNSPEALSRYVTVIIKMRLTISSGDPGQKRNCSGTVLPPSQPREGLDSSTCTRKSLPT